MGKGQKSKYISKLTSKDQAMLHAFRSVGYLSEMNLHHDLGQRDKRIAGFVRDGYVEKCAAFNATKRTTEAVYKLTPKGRDLCLNQLNMNHFYRSNSVQHDRKLAEKYFSLHPDERKFWLTEGDWRELFYQRIEGLREQGDETKAQQLLESLREHTFSPPDAGFFDRIGNVIALEQVTSNYSDSEIQAKIDFADVMGVRLELMIS